MDQAERIIARFGGIRPMAAKLGIAVTTVQGWKERGSIPPARHAQILAAAETEGLALSDEDLMVGGERSPTPLAEEAAPETIEPDFTEPPDIAEPVETLAPEPPQEPPPAYAVRTKPARSPARAALLGGLAGIVVAAGAGLAGWSMRGQTPAGVPPEFSQRLAAIARRADDAEARARAAEVQARAAGAQARAAGAQARAAEAKIAPLAGLRGRLEAAEARARAAAEKIAKLAKQQARLEAAEAGAGEEAVRALTALKSELAQLAARLKATAPSEKLQALGAGLAALKTQVDELASRPQAGTADKAALATLKKEFATVQATLSRQIEKLSGALAGFDKRLAAIDGRVVALGKRFAGPAQAFGRRLSELEKRQASAAGGRGAALIAGIGQLREAVRAGRVFSSELEAVTALAGKDPRLTEPLQRLVPRAGKGIQTAATLVARFSLAVPAIVRAGRFPEDGGWAARAWARARSVVIVRRVGPRVKGAGAEAVVARAEARLASGDVAGAAAMLKRLKGPAGKAAMPWLAAAGAHIEATQAILALHRAALTLIEPPPESKAPTAKPARAKPPTEAKPPAGAKPKAAP